MDCLFEQKSKWILTEFHEDEDKERMLGSFNSKNEAVREGKIRVYAVGDYHYKFTFMDRFNVWTNDSSGMRDGGLTVRRIEI